MTDEEMITQLREAKITQDLRYTLEDAAADRIEALVKEVDRRIEPEQVEDLIKLAEPIMAELYGVECSYREAAEAKLAKAIDALRLVTDACDEGKMVSLGAGGMTIDAQIRRSVYNQVPAWPIEEARSVLAELEKTE